MKRLVSGVKLLVLVGLTAVVLGCGDSVVSAPSPPSKSESPNNRADEPPKLPSLEGSQAPSLHRADVKLGRFYFFEDVPTEDREFIVKDPQRAWDTYQLLARSKRKESMYEDAKSTAFSYYEILTKSGESFPIDLMVGHNSEELFTPDAMRVIAEAYKNGKKPKTPENGPGRDME